MADNNNHLTLVSEVYITHKRDLLMFKRPDDKGFFPGYWMLPGGHIDPGEDPLAAAIREVKEETGIRLSPVNIKLKVVALHQHIDTGKNYFVFAFHAAIPKQLEVEEATIEGRPEWMRISRALELENVFPPVRHYFPHVLEHKPGIIYNTSNWENGELVEVLSETIDMNS